MVNSQSTESERLLRAGLEQLSISLSDIQIGQLLSFIQLIAKWNKTHNLTAIKDPAEMVSKHLIDSLSIAKDFPSGDVLDVGSGAGLPGIPLAILKPQQSFTLLDASLKRVAFLQESRRKLALTNINPIHSRVEDFSGQKFAVITSRAFTSLVNMLQQTEHLLAPDGCWLAMKGVYPSEEIAEVGAQYKIDSTSKVHVPGLSAERHLVQISRC